MVMGGPKRSRVEVRVWTRSCPMVDKKVQSWEDCRDSMLKLKMDEKRPLDERKSTEWKRLGKLN